MQTQHPPPNSADLWAIARALLTRMVIALGAPGIVAAIETLSRKDRRDILDWLAPFEVFVRKLLLAEAALLPRPRDGELTQLQHIQRLLRRAKPARIQRKSVFVEPNRPATWRVSFRLVIPKERAPTELYFTKTPPRLRNLNPPMLVRDIWRAREDEAQRAQRRAANEKRKANRVRCLAARYEALRRVIEEPAPHVERLARKLWRARANAASAARRLAQQNFPRRARAFPEDAFVFARLLAERAIEAFAPPPPLARADSS